MRTMHLQTLWFRAVRGRALPVASDDWPRLAALGAVVLVAAALRFANLSVLGYANHYYAAAVRSMLQSWHNFFFVAAEPGGAVSVDKPPVGLWIQTASAYVFGVNDFGLLLPEIIAGILSVVLVYHLVTRRFGAMAGLLAALVLAITPVVVATDRNNTIDSTLILTLLLAAWAFIVATERGSLRHLLLGVVLVGIGFNIKMLGAYLPLPAFYALYFLGSPERLWRKGANLALATVVLLVVSLSWAVVVDLTPADQRPYVGSSGDNSVMSLAIGYNGTQRLLGMGGRGGALSGLLGGGQDGAPRGGMQPPSWSQSPAAGAQQPRQSATAPSPQQGQRGTGGVQGGFGGGGMSGAGQAGLMRLFTPPLSKEVSWLLPFGLFGAVLLAFRARPRWPLAPKHQALVLWGGWLLVGTAFFSVAGFFHEYYLSVLGPPLAALVGVGAMELWGMRERHPWIAAGLLVAAAVATLRMQIATATAFAGTTWWQPLLLAMAAIGAAVLVVATIRQQWRRAAVAGFGLVVAAMLVTPAIWSGLTTLNSSSNQSLPSAYSGRPSRPSNGGGLELNQALLDYLTRNTQGAKYLMAVPSSMQGADYVLATGRPVLYLGGFMGQDSVVTGDDLDQMVADGELRYIYWSGSGRGGFGGQSDISSWVEANCVPVQGFGTQTRNSGAPDGTMPGGTADGGQSQGGGNMQITLYQVVASASR